MQDKIKRAAEIAEELRPLASQNNAYNADELRVTQERIAVRASVDESVEASC